MSAEINYGYAKSGLNIGEYVVRNGERVNSPLRQLSPEEMPPMGPELSVNQDSAQRVETALNTMRREGRTGYALVNPSEDRWSGQLRVLFHAWGGFSKNPVGENELRAAARQFPGDRILVPDSPATGESAALPRSVSKELAKTGSYRAYGELIERDLGAIINEFSEKGVVIGGPSEGARRALGFAAVMPNISVLDEIHLLDPVGTHPQSFSDIMKGFSSVEAEYTARYTEANPDAYSRERQQANDSPKNLIAAMAKLAARGGLLNQLVREPQAMAQAGLGGDLLSVVARKEEDGERKLKQGMRVDALNVYITIPTESALTNAAAVEGLIGRISESYRHTDVVGRELPNQTHSLRAGHPAVDAALQAV